MNAAGTTALPAAVAPVRRAAYCIRVFTYGRRRPQFVSPDGLLENAGRDAARFDDKSAADKVAARLRRAYPTFTFTVGPLRKDRRTRHPTPVSNACGEGR